jgi:TRAP-type C4-dicarboxylate transport system permease small subunit
MMVSTFLGTADVVGTQFFGQPVHGALEITESTMVVIVFGALTYAQIRRNHIRVELFYTRVGTTDTGCHGCLYGSNGYFIFWITILASLI